MRKSKRSKGSQPSGSGSRARDDETSRQAPFGRVVPVKGPVQPRRALKYVDTAGLFLAYDTTGTITLLNGIAEGDDNTTRNSRSSIMKSVAIRGEASIPLTGLPQKYRTLLVWDNAVNGALPTIATIMQTVNSFGFANIDYEKRYTILYDSTNVLGIYTAALADQVNKDVEAHVELNSITEFNGTGATIASIQNGAIYLVTLGSLGAGATAASLSVNCRVRFLENLE